MHTQILLPEICPMMLVRGQENPADVEEWLQLSISFIDPHLALERQDRMQPPLYRSRGAAQLPEVPAKRSNRFEPTTEAKPRFT